MGLLAFEHVPRGFAWMGMEGPREGEKNRKEKSSCFSLIKQ